METVNLLTVISIAFLGSFGHCIGMCGGIVLAYSTIKIEPQSSKLSQGAAHLLYSLGRVLTYALLGAVFGALGGVATFSNTANGTLLIFAGVVMLHSKSNMSFFVLGMLNGLLPCGFVYFFAITAASTADPLWGALVMAIFGLSTIPAMFGLGFLTSLTSATGFRNMMMSLSSIAVILYGVYTVYNGYEYISDPQKTLRDCH